jgi:hypothetical protein
MLKQQSQKIEVIVRKEGGAGAKNAKETDTENVGSQNGEQSTSTGGLSRRTKRFIQVNSTHAFAVAKQGFNTAMNYMIGSLGQTSGDQSLQQQTERTVEIIQDVSGFATSIAMGAGYGAIGGPLGMALGASFAAVSSAISTGNKYMTRRRDFNYKLFKENNSIEYMRARASINLTTGRLR